MKVLTIFFLIDNGSTDNYIDEINDNLDIITLIKDDTRLKVKGTQNYLINKHFNNNTCCKKYEWTIVCDIDEYIYARNSYKTIPEYLERLGDDVYQIWIPWKIFGHNYNKKQPNCILDNFYRRENLKEGDKNYIFGLGKSICRSKYIKELRIHICSTNNNEPVHDSKGIKLNTKLNCKYPKLDSKYKFNFKLDNLHINHYTFMSEQYYKDVKSVRGGGQSNHSFKYTMNYFYKHSNKHNLVKDYELMKKSY